MADTVHVTTPKNVWTEVLAAGKTAYISNEGGAVIRWVEKATASPPDPAVTQKGHTLNRGEGILRTTPALQSIFVYAVESASQVSVTEQ